MTVMEENGRAQPRRISRNWILLVTVLLIVIVGIPFLSLRHPHPTFAVRDKWECQMLADATDRFQVHHGHRPPAAAMRSVRIYALTQNRHFNFNKYNLNSLMELDDAERLVFWLGGPGPETDFGFRREVYFDFEVSRIVDRDGDGFPEYTSRHDAVYKFDPVTRQVSCDFSNDEFIVTVPTHGLDNRFDTFVNDVNTIHARE